MCVMGESSRPGSGVYELEKDAVRELERELVGALRPMARCAPLSAEDLIKLRAKQAFRLELEASGISGRGAAKLLKVTEGCIRSWLDPRDLKRNPPMWATEALGKEAQIRHAQLAVDALKVGGSR